MKLLFTFLLVVTAVLTQAQQPGTLDKSYGNGGWVYSDNPLIFTHASAVQTDNKLIIADVEYGTNRIAYLLVRYNTDGSLDKSFGKEGLATTVLNYYSSPFKGWSSIKVLPDGKIVAAGYALNFNIDNYPPYDGDIVLAKFNADGTPDASFGNNGVVITDFGEYETAEAMAIAPNGKIVLTGIYSLNGIGYDSRVLTVRYNADGSLDKSFGGTGYAVYTGGSQADDAYAVAVQPDGKVVVGGDYIISHYFMLLRYNEDGSLDNSFGSNGFVKTKIIDDTRPSDESINSLVIDKEGRIVAAGTCLNIAMAVARYKPDGMLDSSFNENGKQIIQTDANAEAKTVLLLKDERILLAGESGGNLALACLQPSGAFDSSFGINGITITDFGGDETCNNAVVQSDGKIVLTGDYAPNVGNPPFYSLIARYNGYPTDKQSPIVRIKRWLQHHGISWQAVQSSSAVRCYTIQRSYDGMVYKDVAKVSPKVNTYEEAASTTTTNNYYRIAATGWDGTRTYSNTVLVDDNQQARIYPNPVRDNLQLQGLPLTGSTNLSVVDLNGNVRSTATTTGSNYSVNTAALGSGSYLLKIQHNGTATTTLPFVKE